MKFIWMEKKTKEIAYKQIDLEDVIKSTILSPQQEQDIAGMEVLEPYKDLTNILKEFINTLLLLEQKMGGLCFFWDSLKVEKVKAERTQAGFKKRVSVPYFDGRSEFQKVFNNVDLVDVFTRKKFSSVKAQQTATHLYFLI
jgi:hypothetical protein